MLRRSRVGAADFADEDVAEVEVAVVEPRAVQPADQPRDVASQGVLGGRGAGTDAR